MSSELARKEFTGEEVNLIRSTLCPTASEMELTLFLNQCKRTGLDPLSRQIHAVKRWDSTQQREVMAIQTGIDGFRLIAERTGKYAGNDDPQYDREDAPHPGKATVTVWKMVDGQRVPFSRSARWSEFVQTKKDGTPTRFWQRMPYLMLGKVAEALALRAAFPQELSGIYTHEEMAQADNEPAERAQQVARQVPGVRTAAELSAAKPKSDPKLTPQVKPDNAPMVAAFAMDFAGCNSRDEFLSLCSKVSQHVKDGHLSENDRLALRDVAKDTSARFPAEAAVA